MASDRSKLSRRHLLSIAGGTLGVAAAGTFRVVGAAEKRGDHAPASQASTSESAPAQQPPPAAMKEVRAMPPASPEALQVLGGLSVGAAVGSWTVAAIHDFHLGAVPVVLATATGERYQVDVLRRDERPGAPRGVAETRHLSLFLSNEGNGSTASNEVQGLGLMTLADALRRRESTAAPGKLLTMEERAARFPQASYKVPV